MAEHKEEAHNDAHAPAADSHGTSGHAPDAHNLEEMLKHAQAPGGHEGAPHADAAKEPAWSYLAPYLSLPAKLYTNTFDGVSKAGRGFYEWFNSYVSYSGHAPKEESHAPAH